jgi:hypothetical protein
LSSDAADSILKLQQLFDDSSRDIADESDEVFNAKFELVYTMGSQQPVEFAPQRWLIIQEILALVRVYSGHVKEKLPLGIEVQTGSEGMYPKVRILRRDARDQLSGLLSKHLVEHGLTGFPTRHENPSMQNAIHRYISRPDLTPEEIQTVEESKFWTPATKDVTLLIRGLLANGVLAFVLGKRWRVNYGLDNLRQPATLLAVPYRFKDGPSLRAEFSHPDVIILLTLLSHYYGKSLIETRICDAYTDLVRAIRWTQ